MRRLITTLFVLSVALLPAAAFAGQIWTDGNGDGAPDVGPLPGVPSQVVTVDVWLDTQSFTFTSFQAWTQYDPQCAQYQSGQVTLAGGVPDIIDTFSNPRGRGMTGSGYAPTHGVVRIGSLSFHLSAVPCCVSPITDTSNPYGTFSIISGTTTYLLFSTASGTCWGQLDSTEPTSWGNIKGLYQ